jgi:hypothetical protein
VQFAVDESEVLGIGRYSDFQVLIREYGNNDVVPGEVPQAETIFIHDNSIPITTEQFSNFVDGCDSDEDVIGYMNDTEGCQ